MTTALTVLWVTDMQAALSPSPALQGKDVTPRSTTKVCFVCTGNTCRSPMAAAVYNHLTRGKDKFAISMGLYAYDGMPISENAVIALEESGIICDRENLYRNHIARSCNEDQLADCEYIVGISEAHTLELISRYPSLVSKIYSMPKDISDPYGGDVEVYKTCLKEIEEGIKELFYLED